MALVLSGSIDISGSMTATTIVVSAPGVAGMVSSSAQIRELAPLMAYTASLKGASIVSSSQQIQNYFTFAVTSSANTFYNSIGTTALNMNNMASLGSIGGGAIYLPYDSGLFFRTLNGATARGKIQADDSNNLLLNSDNAGNVGIGTSTPNQLLSLRKTSIGAETIALALQNIGDSAGTAVSMVFCPHETSATPEPLAKISAIRTAQSGAPTDLAFYTFVTPGGLFERMRIKAGGYIDLNNVVYNDTATSPRSLYIASGGTIGGISSIRASKKNIQNVSNIDWLYQLNPVTFNYRKKDENRNYTEEIYDELTYGLIAEDTQSIADFLINYDDSNSDKKMIGIEYMKLITPMLKAIQEQKAIIDGLIARIEALENN